MPRQRHVMIENTRTFNASIHTPAPIERGLEFAGAESIKNLRTM